LVEFKQRGLLSKLHTPNFSVNQLSISDTVLWSEIFYAPKTENAVFGDFPRNKKPFKNFSLNGFFGVYLAFRTQGFSLVIASLAMIKTNL
jgi:hypothetical protein